MDGRSHRGSRMHRAVGAKLVLSLLRVLPMIGHGFAQVPYTPSSLLYSAEQNASFAYLLRNTGTRTEFISLAVSEKIDTNNPSYTALLDKTPFSNNDATSAYVPAVDQHGVIKVYAGNCWNHGSLPMLWTFEPDSNSSTGNGTWEKFSAHGPEGRAGPVTTRPNHLSAGFAYSASNTTESTFFAFGGMCPYHNDGRTFWTAAANYSQSMTALVPCREGNCYQALTTGERAPPIPEAGFTITPLQATYGLVEGELRQQQDFLLIGGHTQNAFLNMSELAIFSAPQDSWSFVTVGSVTDASRADLASRDSPVIEPRSGHTAVLSSDGSKVVIFGGWVGNTSVAATPQLAVLNIGGDFAGSGEWTWSVPSMIGGPEGLGTYGHGATMLPGGVMMIAGGYKISQLTERSGTGPELNSQIYLYDVAADSWASAYENPNYNPNVEATDGTGSVTSEPSSVFSQKTGLGFGIGLGVPVAAGLGVLFYYCYRRRGKRRTRDHEIRKLALGAQRAHFWGRGDSELASSIRNPSMRQSVNSDYPWSGNNKPRSAGRNSGWNDNGDAAAERTGLLGDIHVPKKLNRPILNAGLYRPPYLDYRRADAAGAIHPIDEREEDEADPVERFQTRETADSLATEQMFITARNTQVDGPAPEGGMSRGGRSSPDKDERTSSNLSDSSGSDKSAKSANKHDTASGHDREAIRSQDSSTSTTPSFDKRYSSDSYSTAHSTMSQRQAEGEYLLRDPDNPESPRMAGLLSSRPAAPTRPRAAEWIGGIRRVLSVSRRRPPTAEEPNTISRASGIDSHSSAVGTQMSDANFPRRSVSASAELFRRKQGAKDWGVGNRVSHDAGFHSARSTRDDFGLDGHRDPVSDGEWDVEGAAEGRRVQVTFTVPKEKLRVVNASAGDMDDMSVNSVSRSNSSS
ncbi:uncharacterized protein BDV17DRAFT_280614 [Aspergillus undulatus]|uniref:uncharacterized protein n=1 Tax=Aspergillus undulatus TaxID=1810928 RepID=UPI003CCDC728